MERDLAGTVARTGQVLTAGGEEKQWFCLGCRGLMERAVEEFSQPGLCPKRLGERGWVARHKKETNPPWLGHEGHKDSESPLKTST